MVESISVEEYHALLEAEKRRKYNNTPTVVDGVVFDSQGEAERWGELLLLKREGHITDLTRQDRFPLVVGGVKIADYVADFTYMEWYEDEQGISRLRFVVEDFKSPATKTAAYRLKKRLMLGCHQIEIRETGR